MFWENPAVVGLILAIPGAALGYLGYRRSLSVDRAAERASQAATISQAVDGLNVLILALQADNKILRDDAIARPLKTLIAEVEKANGP